MKPINEIIKEKPALGWLIFLATIVVVFLLGLLASSITERRAEAMFTYTPQTEISDYEPRDSVWGQNFPREYQSYLKNSEGNFASKYNGNVMIDMLEVDPRLVVLWAGYGFAKDYNQGRGHTYAIEDLQNTLRTGAPVDAESGPMPSTCWTCKGPDVPRLMNELGEKFGDPKKGIEEFYKGKWASKGHQIVNSIGCADCHDPNTMNLRITRPALVEAFERQGKDITKASHQEMRSLVCAQCHVEYYFKGEGKYLTFPWDKGFSAEAMEDYYNENEFKDWTHKLSKAPMLKAQHPGYEVHMTGIHAERGVACADCHMPYISEGGQKYSDHHMQSPLNNISNSCQVCHRESEETLKENVYSRQDKVIENRDELERLLVRAHVEAKTAWELGATDEMMTDILQNIRSAQWFWDYAAASHGGSFHSPVEISRVIAKGITTAQEARIELTRVLIGLGQKEAVPYPDISTKAKAQEFIGIDVAKMKEDKNEFLKTLVPEWKKIANEREMSY
jgi:nitrite reductase (cytochrome c-552)